MSVAPQLISQGLLWTKRRTAAAPVRYAEDAKVALVPRREQRGASWERKSLHEHWPVACCWVTKTVLGQVEGQICGEELRHVRQTRVRATEIWDGLKVFPVVIARKRKG